MFIPDPDLYFLPIPDPGVKKKVPDPGFGSATLTSLINIYYLDVKFELAALPESLLRTHGQNKVVKRIRILEFNAASRRQVLLHLLHLKI
jgi:hypothetical protein